jgi:hypothetical protein
MKASELIQRIASLIGEHGDVPVMIGDSEMGEINIDKVEFIDDIYPLHKNKDGSRIPPFDFIEIW